MARESTVPTETLWINTLRCFRCMVWNGAVLCGSCGGEVVLLPMPEAQPRSGVGFRLRAFDSRLPHRHLDIMDAILPETLHSHPSRYSSRQHVQIFPSMRAAGLPLEGHQTRPRRPAERPTSHAHFLHGRLSIFKTRMPLDRSL